MKRIADAILRKDFQLNGCIVTLGSPPCQAGLTGRPHRDKTYRGGRCPSGAFAVFPDGAAAARQVLALKTEVRILVREWRNKEKRRLWQVALFVFD